MPPENLPGMLGVRNATLRNLRDSVPRLWSNFLPALLLGAWAGEEGSMKFLAAAWKDTQFPSIGNPNVRQTAHGEFKSPAKSGREPIAGIKPRPPDRCCKRASARTSPLGWPLGNGSGSNHRAVT
jgi:hypothetical protein